MRKNLRDAVESAVVLYPGVVGIGVIDVPEVVVIPGKEGVVAIDGAGRVRLNKGTVGGSKNDMQLSEVICFLVRLREGLVVNQPVNKPLDVGVGKRIRRVAAD